MAIFIEWDEKETVFDHWRRFSGGVVTPVFQHVTILKSARFSNDESDEMRKRAKQFITEERPGGRVVVK